MTSNEKELFTAVFLLFTISFNLCYYYWIYYKKIH